MSRWIDHYGAGKHENRPDPLTVPDGYIYACESDGALHRVVNGGWETWAVTGGRSMSYPTDPNGTRLVSAIENHTGRTNVVLVSDSTGNDPFDWPRISMDAIALRWPDEHIKYRLWNHDTLAYPSFQTINEGSDFHPAVPAGIVTLFQDDFNTDVADVLGVTPPIGTPYYGPSGSIGAWSIQNGKLVKTSTATGAVNVDLGATGDTVFTVNGVTISTMGDTANREFNIRIKTHPTADTGIQSRIQIMPTGSANWYLFKRINGAATTLLQGPIGTVPSKVESFTFDAELKLIGNVVSSTINGTTISHTLSPEDMDVFSPLTSVNISSSLGSLIGSSVESMQATVDRMASPDRGPALFFSNGARSGSSLVYQTEHLDAILPTDTDIMIINSSHNYSLMNAADYIATIKTFVETAKARVPGLKVIVTSQNPQFVGVWTQKHADAHLSRLTALRVTAAEEGWGYVPVIESFLALPDKGQSRVLVDGIHPTSMHNDPVSNGCDLWRDVFMAYLDAHSLISKN